MPVLLVGQAVGDGGAGLSAGLSDDDAASADLIQNPPDFSHAVRSGELADQSRQSDPGTHLGVSEKFNELFA